MKNFFKKIFCIHSFDNRPQVEIGRKCNRRLVNNWYPYYVTEYRYTCKKCGIKKYLTDEERFN